VGDAYYKQNLFPACFANGLPLSEANEVKAPHLSMIAAPGVVTQVILKAVHATG
jgi:hypothetical protein